MRTRGHSSRSSPLWAALSKPAETISPQTLASGLCWLLLHMCRVTPLNLLPRIFQGFFSFFSINSSMASRAPGKVTADSLWVLAPWLSLYILDSNLIVATLFSSRNPTPWCTAPPQSHGLPHVGARVCAPLFASARPGWGYLP